MCDDRWHVEHCCGSALALAQDRRQIYRRAKQLVALRRRKFKKPPLSLHVDEHCTRIDGSVGHPGADIDQQPSRWREVQRQTAGFERYDAPWRRLPGRRSLYLMRRRKYQLEAGSGRRSA